MDYYIHDPILAENDIFFEFESDINIAKGDFIDAYYSCEFTYKDLPNCNMYLKGEVVKRLVMVSEEEIELTLSDPLYRIRMWNSDGESRAFKTVTEFVEYLTE